MCINRPGDRHWIGIVPIQYAGGEKYVSVLVNNAFPGCYKSTVNVIREWYDTNFTPCYPSVITGTESSLLKASAEAFGAIPTSHKTDDPSALCTGQRSITEAESRKISEVVKYIAGADVTALDFANIYTAGSTSITLGGTKTFISRGLGCGILPFRFLCVPEATVVEIYL